MADPALFHWSVAIPIRYHDIDAQRHLNNVAALEFGEHARVMYLKAVGLWEGRDFDALGMILAEVSCTYKAPAYLGETVTVWVRASELGTKSFRFQYLLEVEGREIAVGHTVQVCYDYRRKESIPIPDEWRVKITEFEQGNVVRET